MSFSGASIIKMVTEETPYELFTWKFDILICINVSVVSLMIVCPRGMILSEQGVILRDLISDIYVLMTKIHLIE